jgi:histone-lysine N-methyltransferase SETMAR
LGECRISAKSIAEQLGIPRERVESAIHEDLDMRKLSAKWIPKCLNADQKHQRYQSSEQILELFWLDPKDLLSRLVTMVETWLYHYDQEKSNNQWSGGIAAHPTPNIPSSKIR